MQNLQTRRTIMAIAGLAASVAAPLAMAHVSAGGAPHMHDGNALQSLASGALHPLTGLDHLAAMVSVGAWSVLSKPGQSMRSLLTAPAAFAVTLLFGALLALAGLRLPGVEPMIAASLLVMGLLVATRLRLSTSTGAALVAAFAFCHGLAHGTELGGHAMAALTGMVASTAVLHGLGMGVGLALRDPGHGARRWASRLAGAGVALMGLSLLTPAVAAAL